MQLLHGAATYGTIEDIDARLLSDYFCHKNTSIIESYKYKTAKTMDKVISILKQLTLKLTHSNLTDRWKIYFWLVLSISVAITMKNRT